MVAETPVIENFVVYPFPLSITLFFLLLFDLPSTTQMRTPVSMHLHIMRMLLVGGMRAGD